MVEQLEQRVTVFKRKDIGLQGEHLAEFYERPSYLLEYHAQAFWPRNRSTRQASGQPWPTYQASTGQVCEQMPEENGANMHYATQVRHETHQFASLSNTDPKKIDLRRLSISSMASCILVRTSWLIARTVAMSCAASGG